MKAVVIGGRGMLGRAVLDAAQAAGWEVAGYDLPELDITKMDGREVEETDWVVNCAAYTQVDRAETEPTTAFEVNACGAGRVARMCKQRGWKLLHVSTDYVFDGKKRGEYDEDDPTGPLSAYGASKLLGETLVLEECPEALIVRTQSLFGKFGVNFVEAILKQVEEGKKELKVVEDQVSCPTYVGHLASAMVTLMALDAQGVVHVSNEGWLSWYSFAKLILDEVGIRDVVVLPVKAEEFAARAERPAWSVLCKAKYITLTGKEMPAVEDGLRAFLSNRGGGK